MNLPVFSIDSVNGSITVIRVLDREKQDTYVITVAATDNGATPLIGYQTIHVNVKDQNDNRPIFLDPINQSVRISKSTNNEQCYCFSQST